MAALSTAEQQELSASLPTEMVRKAVSKKPSSSSDLSGVSLVLASGPLAPHPLQPFFQAAGT